MSLFEDYEQASLSYDEAGRKPVCVNKIIKKINPKSSLLDAGCGTGNYMRPLLESGKVSKYVAFDASEGMLNQLKKKATLWQQDNKVDVIIEVSQVSLMEPLPFENESFDVIIHNQVMHHLTINEGPDKFLHVRKYLKEFYRVLKVGGVLLINNCTPRQHNSHWWVKHMPSAKRYWDNCAISNEELKELLLHVKFSNICFEIDSEPCLGEVYFDYEKFLSEKYQNADSSWSRGTVEEKKQLLDRLLECTKDTDVHQSFDKAVRNDLATFGQTTEVFAIKN